MRPQKPPLESFSTIYTSLAMRGDFLTQARYQALLLL